MEADSTDSSNGAAQYQRERLLYSGREDRAVTAQYCSREYRSYCPVAESAEFAACYREDKGYCTEEESTYKGYCTVAEST